MLYGTKNNSCLVCEDQSLVHTSPTRDITLLYFLNILHYGSHRRSSSYGQSLCTLLDLYSYNHRQVHTIVILTYLCLLNIFTMSSISNHLYCALDISSGLSLGLSPHYISLHISSNRCLAIPVIDTSCAAGMYYSHK